MRALTRRLAVLVAVGMCLLAGLACGSSKSATAGGPAGQPTAAAPRSTTVPQAHGQPNSPATHRRPGAASPSPANAGSGQGTAAFTKTVLPASTPISSTQYHDAVVDAVGKTKRPQVAEAFANCIQQVLKNAGIETVGQAEGIKQNPSSDKTVANGAIQCLAAASP